eukprot:3252172-Amphidinium_carterae.1
MPGVDALLKHWRGRLHYHLPQETWDLFIVYRGHSKSELEAWTQYHSSGNFYGRTALCILWVSETSEMRAFVESKHAQGRYEVKYNRKANIAHGRRFVDGRSFRAFPDEYWREH